MLHRPFVILVGLALFGGASLAMADPPDFGVLQERRLELGSMRIFGVGRPLDRSATADDVVDRNLADAEDRQFLAGGLRATFVTRAIGGNGDMIAFFPDDIDYTHLIVCNELGRSGTTPAGNPGQNPSVQRVELATGRVETILFGMDRCDGIRTTPWGTILATEESGADGAAYEILDPLGTTGHYVADRGGQGGPGDVRDAVDSPNPSTQVVKRNALVAQSWEGLEVLDNGVVIGGDELRQSRDQDGGAIFRFVPDTLYPCQGAPVRPGQLCDNLITDLGQSPLASGQNYALATVCRRNGDFGQGCEAGRGLWVEVSAAFARRDAADRGATGYCRPEDLHVDRSAGEFDAGTGIRYCFNNTCGGGMGETLCVVEDQMDAKQQVLDPAFGFHLLSSDGALASEAFVTRFLGGDDALNNQDNLDIQPFTSNVYIIEDTPFGDVWACLQDGADRDLRNDGCVRILSIRDPAAEPSGFIFDGTGETAFYHVQHGQQFPELRNLDSNPVDGRTDDLIRIDGFRIHRRHRQPGAGG